MNPYFARIRFVWLLVGVLVVSLVGITGAVGLGIATSAGRDLGYDKDPRMILSDVPVASLQLQVRAQVNGETTPWLSITRCQVTTGIVGSLTPPREVFATFGMAQKFSDASEKLGSKHAQLFAAAEGQVQELSTEEVRRRLKNAHVPQRDIIKYLRAERVVLRYAGSIAGARWPGAVVIQVRVVKVGTIDFEKYGYSQQPISAIELDPNLQDKTPKTLLRRQVTSQYFTTSWRPNLGDVPARDYFLQKYREGGACS